MTTVVRTLKEADEEEWKALQGMSGMFLHGECYAFAIALHMGLGWDIVGLIDPDGIIDHAVVAVPESDEVWDIRGRISRAVAMQPFKAVSARVVSIDELYETRGRIDDPLIRRARLTAETLWPELPWKDSQVAGAAAFVDELEELCRRHGYWLWGGIPAQQPLISPMDHDLFQGYSLKPTIHGTTFIVERNLDRY